MSEVTLEDLFQRLAKMNHHERKQRLWIDVSGISHIPPGQMQEDTFMATIDVVPKQKPINKQELCQGNNHLLYITVPGGIRKR